MSKGNKTFSVQAFKEYVNDALSSDSLEPKERQVLMTTLEHVLFSSRNYKGFGYLTDEQVPRGQLPGVNYTQDKPRLPHPDYEKRFANTDKTRVFYY